MIKNSEFVEFLYNSLWDYHRCNVFVLKTNENGSLSPTLSSIEGTEEEFKSLQKAWDYINKAQNEVSLRFTDDKDCDALVNKAYNKLESLKNKIHQIVEINKWWKQ